MQVKLISHSTAPAGTDLDNVQDLIAYCAKVSNPSNQINKETSEKLISYLIKHNHWSPLGRESHLSGSYGRRKQCGGDRVCSSHRHRHLYGSCRRRFQRPRFQHFFDCARRRRHGWWDRGCNSRFSRCERRLQRPPVQRDGTMLECAWIGHERCRTQAHSVCADGCFFPQTLRVDPACRPGDCRRASKQPRAQTDGQLQR